MTNPEEEDPTELNTMIEAFRDLVRAYAEPRGIGSKDAAVAMCMASLIMLELNFSPTGALCVAEKLVGDWITALALKAQAKGDVPIGAPIARFPLGLVHITPGAAQMIEDHDASARALLRRHQAGDWGDLDEHDRAVNDAALRAGGKLRSWYQLDGSQPRNSMGGVWIMTEADRSTTTILTPEEY